MHFAAPRLLRHSTLPIIKSDYFEEDHPQKPTLHIRSSNLPLPLRAATSAVVAREEGWSAAMSPHSRLRHRSIWDNDLSPERENVGFEPGLIGAGDAPLSKGYRAQAPFPPVFPSLTFGAPTSFERHTEDPLEDDAGSDLGHHYGNGSEWSYDDDAEMDVRDEDASDPYFSAVVCSSPLLEDLSPLDRDEPASSPGPMTPFGDFVDRAVSVPYVTGSCASDVVTAHGGYQAPDCEQYCQECTHELYEPEFSAPALAPVSPQEALKKLAGPMSEWVATFVWKLCTGSMKYEGNVLHVSGRVPEQSNIPPSHLATSIHSLLLSTLLQPSAVLLAMRFLARLPVQLGPIHLPAEQAAEYRFRVTLLGPPGAREREEMESLAPFRLVVLGFMLANKWLDDHTFSNKTWHTISNVPIGWLNKLEMLALDVFRWDLSIGVEEWSAWLSQTAGYHATLLSAPSPYPQPISRPSATPHAVVRKTIEDIRRAVDADPCSQGCCDGTMTQPVFIGLEGRQRERNETWDADVCDIDLDEDGPLREEYVPRRRASKASSTRSCRSCDSARSHSHDRAELDRTLPPPARWSPGADEPLTRTGERRGVVMMPAAPPAPRLMPMDAPYPAWPSAGYQGQHFAPGYGMQPYQAPPPHPIYSYEQGLQPHVYPYQMMAGYGPSPPISAWQHPDYHSYPTAFTQPGWTRIVVH